MPEIQDLFRAAERLHAFLFGRHFGGGVLRGPDVGVRFNLRVWRFLKSTLDFVPWGDDYLFLQAQGYWILSNWMLFDGTGNRRYRELALESSEAALRLQSPAGAWPYPLPERKNLIATVEGDWAALGLVATYGREPRQQFLAGASRWYDFLVNHIGFQPHSRGEAVNYFDKPRGKIPNNSVEAAWLFLRLWKATGDDRYLEHVSPLLDFVAAVQLPNGELPYIVEGPWEKARDHYLCFQYNAFEFLKLAWSRSLRPGTRADLILPGLAAFLKRGVRPSGACAADCARAGRGGPEVDYYTAVLAAALREAARLGLVEPELSQRCYARLLARQRADGAFDFSTGDYGFLSDRRSYPRALVMTLFHLLYGCGAGDGFSSPGNRGPGTGNS